MTNRASMINQFTELFRDIFCSVLYFTISFSDSIDCNYWIFTFMSFANTPRRSLTNHLPPWSQRLPGTALNPHVGWGYYRCTPQKNFRSHILVIGEIWLPSLSPVLWFRYCTSFSKLQKKHKHENRIDRFCMLLFLELKATFTRNVSSCASLTL